MKRIYLILGLIILLFNSCETDFDVNAQWEDITVIMGLLDKSQEIQYVKVNKAFLGEEDAAQMASFSDSLNYDPEDIVVSLHEIKNDLDTIWSRELKDTILEKDSDGIFASDNNIVYYLEGTVLKSSNDDDNNIFTYAITVENLSTGNIVSSSTRVIGDFNFISWDGTSTSGGAGSSEPYELPFYNLIAGNNEGRRPLSWTSNSNPNAVIYNLALRFHYRENGIAKNLLWQLPEVGNDVETLIFEGVDFFNFLSNNLEKNNSVRSFDSIDIEMTLGTEDLKTYMLVNEEITSIVQERPPFTNIVNGIGLFSSRYTRLYSGLLLKSEALDYLNDVDGLDRNFQ